MRMITIPIQLPQLKMFRKMIMRQRTPQPLLLALLAWHGPAGTELRLMDPGPATGNATVMIVRMNPSFNVLMENLLPQSTLTTEIAIV
jgi:hypothetical protein